MKPKNSTPRQGILLLLSAALLWGLLASAPASRLEGRSVDDIFITYRYAQNLVQGEGFVFNPGERVFGTTAPGLALLLALFHVPTRLPIHLLGTASTAVSLVGIALLLLRDGRQRGRTVAALLAGTWTVCCLFVWQYHGSEMPVALLLLLAAAALIPRRAATAGLLAGFAVWCRPESGIGAFWLAALSVAEKRRLPYRYAFATGTTVVVGLLAAWWWFGQPLPNTLPAKRLQAVSDLNMWRGGWHFWENGLAHLAQRYTGGMTPYFVLAGVVGLILLLFRGGRVERLLSLYVLSLSVAYPLVGVSFNGWYAVPVVVGLIYGCVTLFVAVGAAIARRLLSTASTARPWLAAAAVALMLWPLAAELIPRGRRGFEHFKVYSLRHRTYQRAGQWIREHSSPADQVAYVEVGTVAYWSERPIRDLLGLVTPESLAYVESGDMVGAFLVDPAEWVIYHENLKGFMAPILGQPWFAGAYAEAHRFSWPMGEGAVIYRRRPGAVLPAVVESR